MAYDLGTAHGTIEIEYQGSKEVDRAHKDMDKVSRKSDDTDKSLARLGATLGTLGKGAAITGMAIGLTNAAIGAADLAIQLAGVVPQLVSIGSLAAALPGIIVGAGAAMAVFKASIAGVSDAVAAAFDTEHPEKFEEAVKKLSPAAAEFAKAIKANAPGLREFQQGLQETFFRSANLTQAFGRAMGALRSMKPLLVGLADEMGGVVRQFTNFALSADSVSFVQDALVTFRQALISASPAITPILEGLRSVGEVGLPLLQRLGEAAGNVGTKFGEWLSAVSEDGRLQSWIDTALSTLQTLGGIAQNVGGILSSVFGAAAATGGGLLNTIETVTGELNKFLKSAEGQQAITALFTGIGAAAKALAPVFTTLVGALAGALGPALLELATNVGPVLLEVVEALAPAFGPLATAIVDVVTALAPLLPPVAQLVSMLATLGAGILSQLAANLGPIVSLLGAALTGALETLMPVLDQVMAQLPQFANMGLQLAQALAPLLPAIIQVGTALVSALLPYLPQLMESAQQLIPPLVQLATMMASQLASSLQAIIPYLPAIIGFFVRMTQTGLFLVTAGARLAVMFLTLAKTVMGVVSTVVGAMGRFRTAIMNGISNAISTIAGLPGRARAALSSFISTIVGIAQRAWASFRSAVAAGINAAVALARSLPGRVRSAIANLTGLIAAVARTAWAAFRSAVSNGINAAVSLARSLPGRIRGALSGMGSLLVGVGRDVIMGLVRGMTGAIGAAVSAAVNVGKSIIGGVKGALKIGSPSKEMIKIGRFVNDGLVEGLLGSAKQVKAASTKLANMVLDAFSDKLITKKQRNSVLKTLSNGNRQLQALITKANQITGKLKTAQDNLANAKKAYDEIFKEAVQKTKDTFDIVTPGQQFVNLDLTKERFKDAVEQAKQFAKDIAVLTKRGLNKDLLQQLVEAGAADGGAMASALAGATDATLKEFNDLQNQLNQSSNAVGKTAAEAMYGAGVKAAQGLVDGLKRQEQAIEKQMIRIANSMVSAIKKALKIKSPSRIMIDFGEMVGMGLIEGMENLMGQVEKASAALATSSIIPTVQLTAETAASRAQQAVGGTTVGGTVNNFSQTINALPGMDAKQVADYSLTKMRLGLATGMSAAPIPTPVPAGA